MEKKVIDFTPKAKEAVLSIIDAQPRVPLGLRISLRTRGCSGLSWDMELIEDYNGFDEEVVLDGLKVFIDPKAVLFILGSIIDYKKTDLEEGFAFINPNEKSKCGCGESFTV